MKKIIALSLALLVLPMVAFASLDTNLYYGVKNQSQVRELQEFLIDKGLLTSEATGNFYSLTLKAVKKYQELQSLPQTGYVGTMTRGAINQELATLLVDTEAELALEPAVEVAQPTQPVVTQSYGSPVVQSVVEPVSLKRIEIINETVGEVRAGSGCLALKSYVYGDDGEKLSGRNTVRVTNDVVPNAISYIGLTDLDGNNKWNYCPRVDQAGETNVKFTYEPLGLKATFNINILPLDKGL